MTRKPVPSALAMDYPPKPPSRASTQGRLVVTDSVYHQQAGAQPVHAGESYARWIEADEQTYIRRTKIGQEWTPLDCGWVKVASLVHIANNKLDESSNRLNDPELRKVEAEKLTLEVSFFGGHPVIEIPPGESARFCPVPLSTLAIRCRGGVTGAVWHVVPR